MRTGVIVLADDEDLQREALARALRGRGHEVIPATGGEAAVVAVRERAVDVLITDLRMPDLSGLEVLRRGRALNPELAVIVLTAYGTIDGAVEAMQSGAVHYLTKPVDLGELELVVERALERRDLVHENLVLRRRLQQSGAEFRLIGESQALQEVLARAARAAATDATVLILGESGTGKELLARSIHDLGARAEGPFIAVNCAALPESLLESELFGHERGAFTGATSLHRGRIERAAEGTLFLDEIGDLPAAVQVKLLRFLQEREFTRVGGEATLRADVRIMAATHRDLESRVASGGFRTDLFYRLDVVRLVLPPLRERRSDVPVLAEHFLAKHSGRHGLPVRGLSSEAMDALIKYDYPGNVRELENAIEQAVVLAAGQLVLIEDLPAPIRRGTVHGAAIPSPDSAARDLASRMDEIERNLVLGVLARHAGNQSSAARELGVTEGGLRYKLRKWSGSGAPAEEPGADA